MPSSDKDKGRDRDRDKEIIVKLELCTLWLSTCKPSLFKGFVINENLLLLDSLYIDCSLFYNTLSARKLYQ